MHDHIDLAQYHRDILTLSGEDDAMFDVELTSKRLHFGLVTALGGMRTDHQESDVASTILKNPRGVQINFDALPRNDAADARADRCPRRDAELFADRTNFADSFWGRRNHNAVSDDLDLVGCHSLLEEPVPACIAVHDVTCL